MVRHWFSLTAVLAVAVLVLATDASQSRERRLGRRFRARSDAYVDYGPQRPMTASAEDGALAETKTGGRRADYRAPEGQRSSARARPVLLEVRVPADAEIWIEGAKTVQKGTVRQFISPAIEPGPHYTYEIKAKWMEKGEERTQTRHPMVHPGRRLMVDLTRPSEEKP